MDGQTAIRTAARWWADKLRKKQPHSNGDNSYASIFACLMADMQTKSISEYQLEVFTAELEKQIGKAMKDTRNFWLSCDYFPNIFLEKAAKKAGIDTMNFPFKTHMCFEQNGTDDYSVLVADGYGMPYTALPPMRWEISDG